VSQLVIFKNESGKLEGFGEKGRRAWLKFLKVVEGMAPGETLGFTYKLPRSPEHHRFFFLKLAGLFQRQEGFSDQGRLLDWLKVGAGHVDLVPGRDGVADALGVNDSRFRPHPYIKDEIGGMVKLRFSKGPQV